MTPAPLSQLRSALDAIVVGQQEAKAGLLLALLAREHAYLEGPPGCAKTLLAEGFAALTGGRTAAIRFHRDVGEADLLGDPVLQRRRTATGDRLAFGHDRGPLLLAEIAVLDDLSRAPGEALTPLLRVLDQRRLGEHPLPLEMAIATGCPPGADACIDPLEPTQLDRFAIQVRMHGALCSADARWARALLEWRSPEAIVPVLSAQVRGELQHTAAQLTIGDGVRAALLQLAQRVAAAVPTGMRGAITDRAFSRMALAVLRAHAMLRGAKRVERVDLAALRYMLGCRVPETVRERLESWIDEAMVEDQIAVSAVSVSVLDHGAPVGEDVGGTRVRPAAASGALPQVEGAVATGSSDRPAEVEPLLRALTGRIEHGRVEPGDDPGGQPRRYRRLRRLDEILDADALEAMLFVEGRLVGTPRTFQRRRRKMGGTLAVLRDVSASMEGRLSRCAGEIVGGLFHAGARQHMRIGYVEFNHRAEVFRASGRFFHRHYARLRPLAGARRAEGRTSYEAPLRAALDEFRGGPRGNRHVVLLTDGVPVLGDPTVARERTLARDLGVRIHTVFVGDGECPAVLDTISRETDGGRFRASAGTGGRLRVRGRP